MRAACCLLMSLRLGLRMKATGEVGNPSPWVAMSYKEGGGNPAICSRMCLCACLVPGSLRIHTYKAHSQGPGYSTQLRTPASGNQERCALGKLPTPTLGGVVWGLGDGVWKGTCLRPARYMLMRMRKLPPFGGRSVCGKRFIHITSGVECCSADVLSQHPSFPSLLSKMDVMLRGRVQFWVSWQFWVSCAWFKA